MCVMGKGLLAAVIGSSYILLPKMCHSLSSFACIGELRYAGGLFFCLVDFVFKKIFLLKQSVRI